jgi:ubiquinone/menaquinone biosynthesis C-methylase UbiE
MGVDFGKTANDYARYRTQFPPQLFALLADMNIGVSGQRLVDLGTGTGVLARQFAAAGCQVTGLDVAPEMLDQAREQDRAAGVSVTYQVSGAEDTGLPSQEWDTVTAAQCWHWFDRPRVAAEVRRLLVDGGRLAICYRDYSGEVSEAAEELVHVYNPTWPLGGLTFDNHPEWVAELRAAGFARIDTFGFNTTVEFTHEQWRGRMRSSNGVGGSLPAEQVAAFDADLAKLLLERFPKEPLSVPHRIWGIVAHD